MDSILKKLFSAADAHGEDSGEPDHTVGDLQDLLRETWSLMTPSQKLALLNSDTTDNVAMTGGEFNAQDLIAEFEFLIANGTDQTDGILVSLDGGVSYQSAPEGVRIIYQNIPIDGEDGAGEVHINATHEGLITDVWTTREEPLDHNIGTDSVLIDDLITRLVGENG